MQTTDLQNDSINIILESLKEHTKNNTILFRTLFHKGNTGNIILRPYKPEEVKSHTFIIDVMGNRERIDETKYEELSTSSYQ